MKKQHLSQGKKLSKRELKTIAGGKKICGSNGMCLQVSPTCMEPACQGTAPVQCSTPQGTCGRIAPNCEEPACRPNIELPPHG
nr:hypothetical protein [uncultured Chryseobacterium sp.]